MEASQAKLCLFLLADFNPPVTEWSVPSVAVCKSVRVCVYVSFERSMWDERIVALWPWTALTLSDKSSLCNNIFLYVVTKVWSHCQLNQILCVCENILGPFCAHTVLQAWTWAASWVRMLHPWEQDIIASSWRWWTRHAGRCKRADSTGGDGAEAARVMEVTHFHLHHYKKEPLGSKKTG